MDGVIASGPPLPIVYVVDDDYCGTSMMLQIEYPDDYQGAEFGYVLLRIGNENNLLFESALKRTDSLGTYFCLSSDLQEQTTIDIAYGLSFCSGASALFTVSLESLDVKSNRKVKFKEEYSGHSDCTDKSLSPAKD